MASQGGRAIDAGWRGFMPRHPHFFRTILMRTFLAGWVLLGAAALVAQPPALEQKPNTWVKRSPLKDGPVSPGMGYEASLGYDPKAKFVIRWGGHNQGGGGEQNAETWVYDP